MPAPRHKATTNAIQPVKLDPDARMRKLSLEEKNKLGQYLIDFRFVREVERMEREGRVKWPRANLERELGMNVGVIAEIRAGKRGVLPVHIARLKLLCNSDTSYILLGVRDPDHSSPYAGARRFAVHEPYYFRYGKPAGWKAGPQPETPTPNPDGSDTLYSAYYPEDPENKLWAPHKIAGKHAHARVKKGEQVEAQE